MMRRALTFGLFIAVSLGLGSTALADKPYFKVFEGDVFAGGWFNSGNTACTSGGPYQGPTYSSGNPTGATEHLGGIMAFNKNDGSGRPRGAASDFGAMALGLIEGHTSHEWGFSSGDNNDHSRLSFANHNDTATYWGGYLGGDNVTMHCIPDYYSKANNPKAWPDNTKLNNIANGQYKITAGAAPFDLTAADNGNIKLKKNQKVTVYVDGDVYIGRSIEYPDNYQLDELVKFTVVAKGDIFISEKVSTLSGLYVAQPAGDGTKGIIWTCHSKSATAYTSAELWNKCDERLRFNGAVVARQINLLRTKGDIEKAKFKEDKDIENDEGDSVSNNRIAESFVYTPDMLIGGSMFSEPAGSGSGGSYTLDSLVSLPPVF